MLSSKWLVLEKSICISYLSGFQLRHAQGTGRVHSQVNWCKLISTFPELTGSCASQDRSHREGGKHRTSDQFFRREGKCCAGEAAGQGDS